MNGDTAYQERLDSARRTARQIRAWQKAHGEQVPEGPTAEKDIEDIARFVSDAPHPSPELARQLARLLGGGRHG